MQQASTIWLIKSSGKILGPAPTERVIELLRTREVSVLDEVSQPLRRWVTIQYHDDFREVVDSLRKASLSERTEAAWSPAGTSVTNTLTDVGGTTVATDDITQSVTNSFTMTAKEIVVDQVKEVPSSSTTPSAPVGRYASQQQKNTAVQKQVEKNTRGLWMVTISVLVCVAAFIVFKRFSGGAFEGRLSGASSKQSILSMIAIGNYREALRTLRATYADPMRADDLAVYYGALLIYLEQQTVPGRRVLKKVAETRPQDAKVAYTALGLADLFDSLSDGAQQNFEQALKLDPDFVPALVNLASLHMSRGDYARAKSTALKALKKNPHSGEAILALADAQNLLHKSGAPLTEIAQVNQQLKNFSDSHWIFESEIRFYSLYFDFIREEKNLDDLILAFLDRDPRMSVDHRRSFLIFPQRFGWDNLARYCEHMVSRLGSSPARVTLLAACHAHEGRWDLAKRDIDRAVTQEPKDPLIQAWHSYILEQGGEKPQASVVLARANELNRMGIYSLPVLLQARFCQDKEDYGCARRLWQALYERDLEYLPAISGLASIHQRQKSFKEAMRTVDRGLKLSPEYIPLLTLKNKGEQEGWNAQK